MTGRSFSRRDTARPPRGGQPREAKRGDAVDAVQVDFGPLNQYLGFYLRRLHEDYRRHFVAHSGDLDIQPREVGALFVIGLNPGLTPSQLSVALAMDGAPITTMLNLFDRRGLIERRVSSMDGRSRRIHLTAEGRKMLKHLRKLVDDFDRQFTGEALTDAELAQLIGLLSKLLAVVDE
ncbi:MAG: MarR family transcriptional regulator [Caulobacter sp.]|nr:MarR family transcriptional regulator [Caulobacter sp.]